MPTVNTGWASFWKAALIAPWGVPMAISFSIVWEAVSDFGLSGLSDLPATILLVLLFGLPISYGVMLLLGLPYLMWLRSKGWLNWIFVCVGATVLGSAIWSGYWQLSLHPPSLMRTIPIGALAGLFVGVIFSLVAKLPR